MLGLLLPKERWALRLGLVTGFTCDKKHTPLAVHVNIPDEKFSRPDVDFSRPVPRR
jgi:hypothetical protein